MWQRWAHDRAAFQRSMDQIFDWDFDRMAVAHGEIGEDGAHDLAEHALQEMTLID